MCLRDSLDDDAVHVKVLVEVAQNAEEALGHLVWVVLVTEAYLDQAPRS